ncbi:MAG: putative motility protein [Planctomycetota bacterium]
MGFDMGFSTATASITNGTSPAVAAAGDSYGISILQKATDLQKTAVNMLLGSLPQPAPPSLDSNLGQNLNVYA